MTARTRPGVVLAIVCIGIVLATLDLFIVNIAFPALQRGFGGAKLSSLSWVLNAYAIVVAALLVPAGRLADRSSRKGGFLLGVLVFTLASALCAAANSVALLVAARVVQAAGAALLIPCSLGLLLAAFPPEKRAGAVRVWAAMSGIAAAVGPVLGGVLVSVSWRWIFLVNVPVGIAALVAGRRWLPSPPREREPLPDLLGSLVFAAGWALVTLALVEAPTWGWGSGRTLGALAGGLLLVAGFLRRSARHPSPVLELGLLRVRAFAVSVGAMFVFSAAFAGMLLSVVVWAQTAWGWSALKTGIAFAPGPLMVPIFAVGAGRLVARVGAGPVAAAGGLVYAAGAAIWVMRIGLHPNYAGAMLPGALLTGTGVGLTLPTWTAAAASSLPAHRFATGSAVINMSRQVGYTVGVGVLISVLGRPAGSTALLHAYRHGWAMIGGLALASGIVSLFLSGRRRAAGVPELASS